MRLSDASRRVRHAMKLLLLPVNVRIRGGPLRGMRWALMSGGRFAKGNYEAYKTTAFVDAVRLNDVVYDVGAHVGYYTAIASRLVGESGQVIAFEPRPLNMRFLRRHIRLNGLTNVRPFEAAVGAQAGTARFDTRYGTGTGRVSPDGDVPVETVSIDEMVARGELPAPDLLKIDVEGGEVAVLRGAARTIEEARPRILLATHDPEGHDFCVQVLTEAGYDLRILDRPDERGDTEILALPRS